MRTTGYIVGVECKVCNKALATQEPYGLAARECVSQSLRDASATHSRDCKGTAVHFRMLEADFAEKNKQVNNGS